MFKFFRTFLSISVLLAFAAFWAVGQIPGLHVHEKHVFVLHQNGECEHADRQHSDLGGFPSEDSHEDNCLICHLSQGFHSLVSSPVDVVFNSPVFVSSVSQSTFKLQSVLSNHSSRAPPLV